VIRLSEDKNIFSLCTSRFVLTILPQPNIIEMDTRPRLDRFLNVPGGWDSSMPEWRALPMTTTSSAGSLDGIETRSSAASCPSSRSYPTNVPSLYCAHPNRGDLNGGPTRFIERKADVHQHHKSTYEKLLDRLTKLWRGDRIPVARPIHVSQVCNEVVAFRKQKQVRQLRTPSRYNSLMCMSISSQPR
jgi:hypothetical protein